MKRTVLIIVILVICVYAPNIVWLNYSTARITNGGTETLSSVIVHVDNKETRLSELLPGESRFILLPKSGDGTYEVSYGNTENSEPVCKDYVEGAMYHAETILAGPNGPVCKVTLPLFSELLILKMV